MRLGHEPAPNVFDNQGERPTEINLHLEGDEFDAIDIRRRALLRGGGKGVG
jgi:hypothetical protein